MLTKLHISPEKLADLQSLLNSLFEKKLLITLETDEDGSPIVDDRDLGRLNKLLPLIDSGYTIEEMKKIAITLFGKTDKRTREKAYTVGQFAKQLGLTRRTVDFWIEKGLLKPYVMANNGPRYFTEAELRTARRIEELKLVGYSLEQIKELFSVLSEGNGEALNEFTEKLAERVRAAKYAISSIERNLLPEMKSKAKD